MAGVRESLDFGMPDARKPHRSQIAFGVKADVAGGVS